ncbi:MAG TPA: site-specific integrase [Terriglobales bacterium]|nr:site-specific integrase [Terriglobales bacterium]
MYEKSDAFYLRFYTRDAEGKPVQKSAFLHVKDDKHHSTKCKPVKELQADKIREVTRTRAQKEMLITDFWRDEYLPFINGNRRASTVAGYQQIWTSQLEAHFADRMLHDYQTHHGSAFLTSLTKKYGKRTLAHLRSLASGIFALAQNKGLIERNPWHDVSILAKIKEPATQKHYTLAEILAIRDALDGNVDAQLAMFLAFFGGLRQSEMQGLRWEDIRDGQLHIQRGVVRGKLDDLKTKSSVRVVPLTTHLQTLLQLWHEQCGSPAEGYVLSVTGNPPDLRHLARKKIKPALAKAGLQYFGYHAARHGLGTILSELSKGLIAAQEVLGHSTPITTGLFYKMKTENSAVAAMKLLSAATDEAITRQG